MPVVDISTEPTSDQAQEQPQSTSSDNTARVERPPGAPPQLAFPPPPPIMQLPTLDLFSKRLLRRIPVCGTCHSHHDVGPRSCDGYPVCGRCEQLGHSSCRYPLCPKEECKDLNCTWLHPDQWNAEMEGYTRQVFSQDPTRYGRRF